ncbi:MAG: YtxH domain-containing protein [Coriobacteriales bacterium]|jgi:gas vesicle protein|nr:YtxH domain-containing protein [Coriobacteriales bacterium]
MGKFGSFVIGGLVGAALGILFAPRSGEETRAQLAEKADEYWGKGVSFYDQGKARVQEGVAGVQPVINQKSDELRAKIDNARTLIAEQVAKNAAAARDAINDKVPVAAEKINSAVDVVRGQLDNAASALRTKASAIATEDGESPAPAPVAPADPLAAPDKVEPFAAASVAPASETPTPASASFAEPPAAQ